MAAAFWLISDLDDTIKISHTKSKLITVYRGLFRSSAFAGMPELYREMLGDRKDSFFIVSSSPPAIKKKIEYFLTKNHFNAATLVLRDWRQEKSVIRFKMKRIFQLIEQAPCQVILVGDDTQYDPEVFRHAKKKFKDKVSAIYVRSIEGRKLPKGCVPFFTAFDVACAELAAGRLRSDQVLKVGEAVLLAEKNSRLIPRFSLKPPLSFIPFLSAVDLPLQEIWKKIQARIESMPKRKVK